MLSESELNTAWGYREVWVGSVQIHIEKSLWILGEQLSDPFPAVHGARRQWELGTLTAEEQPGNLAGDRENESCGSGPGPSKADTGKASHPSFSVQGGWVLAQLAQGPWEQSSLQCRADAAF